jgi:predicted amidohydrolase YtcJ
LKCALFIGAHFLFLPKPFKMKKFLFVFLFCGILTSCEEKESADLLVTNAKVYTVNDDFTTAEAFAVKDGKFLAVGTTAEIQEKFKAQEIIDAGGKAVFPGLIDAHAHFYGLGMQLQRVDLTETNSFEEVVARITEFQKEKNADFIVGRGWDQNDWEVKEFPVKDTLDILFPDTPVAITRIDGHALLANQAALDAAGITVDTPAEGGERKEGWETHRYSYRQPNGFGGKLNSKGQYRR